MRVLVLYTRPPEVLSPDRTVWEFELSAAAAFVAKALRAAVRGVYGNPAEIIGVLNETRPDVVFNLCEAPMGRPDLEAHVASFFEWAGVRFTGCGSETLALCRRKDVTSAALRGACIPVPLDIDPTDPGFPCVVKPAAEDGSAGIHDHSLCHNEEQLQFALSQLTPPLIVQEFIPGREFSVYLWGCTSPDYFSIGETSCGPERQLITYDSKWKGTDEHPANSRTPESTPLEPDVEAEILRVARSTWKIVGARHALKIDIRLDHAAIPRVLDVNPNPVISPTMGICQAVREAGWRWEQFVEKLVEWA